MSLQLPSEVIVDRFLPTARAMLATALRDHGLTQEEIATWLGVTQAAVSKYVSEEVTVERRFRENPRMQRTISRIADGIATQSMDEYQALGELLTLIREFEDRGPICEVHEEEMPALQGVGCDLCVRGFDREVATERSIIADVRKGARLLADSPATGDAIPNVGTNIGMALPDAEDELDVAAIPGRMHTMHGRINIPSNPEFGASKHVARMILTAMAVDMEMRGALNIATIDSVLDAATDQGIDPLEFDAAYENRADRLEALFEERGAVPRVIYHDGAYGIEPITYVLGESAVDAANLAVSLAEAEPHG